MSDGQGPIKTIGAINVRSFAKFTLELDPHLNVIVGPSDAGKSNIVRTIRSVVENDSLSAMARTGMGEKDWVEAVLGFEIFSVALHKEHASRVNQYVLNTRTGKGPNQNAMTFTSVGSTVPEQVATPLNMGPVSLAGESVSLNISSQRGPVLGVDSSPAELGRIVGAVSGLDVIFRAVRRAERERRESAASAKAARDSFSDARTRYQQSKRQVDIGTIERALKAAGDLEYKATQALAQARGIDAALQGVSEAARALKTLNTRSNAIAGAQERVYLALAYADKTVQEHERLGGAIDGVVAAMQLARGSLHEIARLTRERDGARQGFDNLMRELGTCPLCERAIK